MVEPGVVIAHTDLKTGKMTCLVSTGIVQPPTRGISYSASRLIGLIQTDDVIYMLIARGGARKAEEEFGSPWVFKRGHYQVEVVSKLTGAKRGGPVLEREASPLVPGDTLQSNDFKLTEKGFEAFGVHYEVWKDGNPRKVVDP
jgi:hypothetical protein